MTSFPCEVVLAYSFLKLTKTVTTKNTSALLSLTDISFFVVNHSCELAGKVF